MGRFRSTTLLTALALVTFLSRSPSARSEIYRYVRPDGTVLYTTEPIRGESPAEVIGGEEDDETQVASPPPTQQNPNPTRDPDRFDQIIRRAATTYGLPFEFVKAVIRVESAFDPHSLSHAGAMGLMQLMPRTAESLNCTDPYDPEQNILAGTQYLRILSNRYNGDLNLILAAYNAGSGAVSRFDGIPYEATRRYIERVYQYYQEYLNAAQPVP